MNQTIKYILLILLLLLMKCGNIEKITLEKTTKSKKQEIIDTISYQNCTYIIKDQFGMYHVVKYYNGNENYVFMYNLSELIKPCKTKVIVNEKSETEVLEEKFRELEKKVNKLNDF